MLLLKVMFVKTMSNIKILRTMKKSRLKNYMNTIVAPKMTGMTKLR